MIETLIVGSILGREVISQSVTEVTKLTYSNLKTLLENDEFIFKNLLEELDINVKIQIIESIIRDLDNNKLNKLEGTKLSKPIHICLINLHNIIEKINKEIIQIKDKSKEQTQLWFSRFRSNPVIYLIENLKKHTKIMDNRLELLIKLLTIS